MFELFERTLGRTSNQIPTIGLQKKGTLSLNTAALTLLLGTQTTRPTKNAGASAAANKAPKQPGPKAKHQPVAYVELLYDKARGIVGIRLASPDNRNSYAIRKQPGSESFLLAGKAFFDYHKVELGIVRRFTPRIYEGNILGFNLSEA
jgi:hypothetical protein